LKSVPPLSEQGLYPFGASSIPAAPGFSSTGHAPVPTEAAYDFKTALVSFKGRLRRQHFWISWLIVMGLSVVLGWIPFLGLLVSLALLWPWTVITIKRLHDMGKTGWLALVPWIGTLVGIVMMIMSVGMAAFRNPEYFENLENEDPALVLSMLGGMMGGLAILVLVNLAFLVWIGISDSQRGDNRYGPNPKGQ